MMGPKQAGSELRAAILRYKHAFITVAILSAVLNILLLGGSLYMMLVYDSVLPSHSVPTLFGLMAMILVVYAFQGLFETMRSGILARIATDLDRTMSPRVQRAIGRAKLLGGNLPGDGLMLMRDFDSVRAFLAGAGPGALIDLPWILFFLGILFLLHVWLGVTALVGALVLVALTLVTDRKTRAPIADVSQIASVRNGLAEDRLRHIELITVLGMDSRSAARWDQVNHRYADANDRMTRSATRLGNLSKMFRMILQSAILTVGALLVIKGQASGGVIFASSILAGRALAPVDLAIANYRGFGAARLGWRRVEELLARIGEAPEPAVRLPTPTRELLVDNIVVTPPGSQRIAVANAHFRLSAGDALGIVGPSAAGKTSLGRALIGAWPAARGHIRLDGATLDQWSSDTRGAFIGYLPQSVELMDGSVADNIARFETDPDAEAVIAAAQAAGVHDMIVQLPGGYETPVGTDGTQLSAGQRQRIGLARALYRDPFLVLLDEPNSNLDAVGEDALGRAIASIRARGGIAVVIAHRTTVLAHVNLICLMRDGRIDEIGPRDEVLAKLAPRPPAPKPPSGVRLAAAGGSTEGRA